MFNRPASLAIRPYLENRNGNVAYIFAIMAIPLLALVGIAIDVQNTNTSRNTVQYIIDNAVIAGAREMQAGKTQDQITAYIDNYVSTAVDGHSTGLNCETPIVQYSSSSKDINANITCRQATTLTQLIGHTYLDFKVTSASTYSVSDVDVAFVFDVSGSMGNSGKMDALKSAAQDAVDILLPSTATLQGDVRLGMVSYSSMVDAGSDYFKKVTNTNSSRTYTYTGEICTKKKKGWDCAHGTTTKTVDNTCVKERIGLQSFTDADPGPNAWLEPAEATFDGKNWDVETCNPIAPLPLTDNRTKLADYISSLNPSGMTAGHIGVAWGWYLIAEDWSSVWPSASKPMAYDKAASVKAIILMTDGEFNTAYNTTNGDSFAQAQSMCDAIKNQAGIRIYTVAFSAPTAGQQILNYCATDPSYAFTADNETELKDAYKKIAESISELRIMY